MCVQYWYATPSHPVSPPFVNHSEDYQIIVCVIDCILSCIQDLLEYLNKVSYCLLLGVLQHASRNKIQANRYLVPGTHDRAHYTVDMLDHSPSFRPSLRHVSFLAYPTIIIIVGVRLCWFVWIQLFRGWQERHSALSKQGMDRHYYG